MSRRMLSSGVNVTKWSALDPEHKARPTEDQVGDAMQRLARELYDMAQKRIAGGAGWTIGDEMETNLIQADDGWVLRGSIIMTRAD